MTKKISSLFIIGIFAMSTQIVNAVPKLPSAQEIKAEKEKHYAAEVLRMKSRVAANDAADTKRLGFPYLLAYHAGRSASMIIPGLNEKDTQTAQAKCSILILDGMGDVIYGVNHMAYRKSMTDYAVEFNKINYKECTNK